jgi:hypothetical protein
MISEALLDRGAFAALVREFNHHAQNPEVDWRPETPSAATRPALLAGEVRVAAQPASRSSPFVYASSRRA